MHTYRESRRSITWSAPFRRWIAVALGMGMLQTSYLLGVSISIADIVALIAILLLSSETRFPVGPLLFLMVVVSIEILAATCITPERFQVYPDWLQVASGLLKLMAAFVYFILGFGLVRSGDAPLTVLSYAWGAVALAVAGVVLGYHDLPGRHAFYPDGLRLAGLALDPNLCAVMLCCALPHFVNTPRRSVVLKALPIVALALGVLASGSKSGVFTFVTVLVFGSVYRAVGGRGGRPSGVRPATIAAVLITVLALAAWLGLSSTPSVNLLPATDRALSLIADPGGALNDQGSSRMAVFATAATMIAASPILGVGAGMYLPVAGVLSPLPAVAHNTYLQLASEWGLPLTLLFFGTIIALMFRCRALGASPFPASLLGILVAILAGSLSVSLNNFRLWWFAIGALWVVAADPGWAPSTLSGRQQGRSHA